MEHLESSAILYYLALTLIHFLWQGGLIALALKFCFVVTPFKHSQVRYLMACFALIACLIAPALTFYLIFQPEISPSAILQNVLPTTNNTDLFILSEKRSWHHDVLGSLPYISILWLSTVALLAMKLFVELYHVNQLPRKGTSPAKQALAQQFDLLVKRMELTRKPKLLISLSTDVPMAIGWLKPVVLLPAAMLTGLTPAQLDMLILHELAHIRRHDFIVNFIQTIIDTLLFFHPSVRWISKQIRNEREYCSDDIAVELSGNPVAYAHTLADTASLCQHHRHHAIPNMAMAASGGDLKQRVVRLVDQHHCSQTDDSGKFLASVLIIVSIFAVALKPYIHLPIIDLSSGRISFFPASNEFQIHQADNPSLAEASIASLLMKQEKGEDIISRPVIDVETITDKPSSISEYVAPDTSVTGEDGKFLVNHSNNKEIVVDNVTEKQVTLKPQLTKKSEVAEIDITDNLDAFRLPEKTQTELAFERTDSKNQKSMLKNPYSTQVAELISEPVQPVSIESVEEFSLPAPRATALAFPTQSQPSTNLRISPENKRLDAKLLTSRDPRYPATAKRRGLEMDIKVNFTIDKFGKVKNIEFEKKSRVGYFKSAIRNAMVRWKFQPAQLNGKPVESQMSKIFAFNLME